MKLFKEGMALVNRDKLREILTSRYSGTLTPNNNEYYKSILIKFYHELKQIEIDKEVKYNSLDGFHYSFLPNLIDLRQELIVENYERACGECEKFLIFQDYSQGRVLMNMQKLLEKYIG